MDYSNIILEMLDRIKTLEAEVAALKSCRKEQGVEINGYIGDGETADEKRRSKRDMTRYMFEGNVYLKNRLVYAVVRRYVQSHPEITRKQLKEVFYKSIQGSIGVVVECEVAKMTRSDYSVRFFARPDEILHLADGDMFVCTQWGIGNIPQFLRIAEQLGYQIVAIKQ